MPRINIIECCALIIPIFIESKSATAGTVQTKRNRSCLGPYTMHNFVSFEHFLWENKRFDTEEDEIEREGEKHRNKINRQNTMANRKFIQMIFRYE